jgi:putative transposase
VYHISVTAKSDDIRIGRHAVSACHAHLVFVTKYRRGALTGAMIDLCHNVMAEVCASFGCELQELEGEDDHVHLLVSFPPTVQLSRLVNSLKGVSARRLRQTFPTHVRRYLWGGHFWSRSYFVGTCGGAPLSVLKAYIYNQRRPT